MKTKSLRNVAFFVVIMTMTIVFSVPAFAADDSVKDDIAQQIASQSVYPSETVKTKISGSQASISVLKYAPSKPKDDIVINHGYGRDVFVEKYQNGKWETVRTYKAGKGNRSKKINIDFSAKNYNKKTIKWRVRVPQLTVTEKERVKGSVITKKVTYKAAVKKTKTVVNKFRWPLKGHRHISSRFGGRICPFHGYEFHPAVDIPAASGTKVMAAADGVVVAAGRVPSFGNRIIIRHGGKNVKTWYNHLSKIKVKRGQKVKSGQVIGKVGSTGDSTGPHLDFRIFIHGKAKNPCKYAK